MSEVCGNHVWTGREVKGSLLHSCLTCSPGDSIGCQGEAEQGALLLPPSVPTQLLLRGGEAPKATPAVRL